MALTQANRSGVIPEKYRSTRYKADCWYHLADYYNKTGLWLAFEDYKKRGDKTCKPGVFEDVRAEMKLDVVFKKPEAPRGPIDPDGYARPKETHGTPASEVYHATAGAPIASALAGGLDRAAKDKPKRTGPVTVERRAEAERWLREHLDSGYAPFKLEFQEPDFDNAWWQKTRNRFLQPQPQENSMASPVTARKYGKPPSKDSVRIQEYLRSLSPDRLAGITFSTYLEKTGHRGAKATIFNSVKSRLRHGIAAGAKPASAAAAIKPTRPKKSPPPAAGTRFDTLAEIELSAFSTCATKDLRAFAMELVKAIHPRGAEAKVVILAEPPLMEIRVPV